jgi:geranylgeranyl pyrophosphate synthase
VTKALECCIPGGALSDLRESIIDEWESSYPIRGHLTCIGYELGGGRRADILDVATAIEVAKIATVVLDDVIDRAEAREGTSLYGSSGEGVPLLLCDVLKGAATSLIARAIGQRGFRNGLGAMESFEAMYHRVSQSQLLDLLYENHGVITEREYLRMIRLGTAGFLESAAGIGFLLVRPLDAAGRHLRAYARSLGVALQIYDDVADLFPLGGKGTAGDVRRRKQRLPLVRFLNTCGEAERKRTVLLLRQPRMSSDAVRVLVRLFQTRGTIDYCIGRAEEAAARARSHALHIWQSSIRERLDALTILIRPEVLSAESPLPRQEASRSATSRKRQ